MNILFLLTQSLDSPSGLGRYRPLALQLSRLGHHVHILALHPNYAKLRHKQLQEDGILIHYVSQMHVRKSGSAKSYFPTPILLLHMLVATAKLTLAAWKIRAEIICVGKPHPMNGIAGLLARRLRGGALWVDCDDYEAASGRFASQLQRRVVAWFEKRLPRYADLVTTNTRFMQQNLVTWGVAPEKLLYLPNGVDPERIRPVHPQIIADLRRELNLSDSPIVLYLGSLSLPSHPVDLLLRAFARIRERLPQATLLIVGGGEDLIHLQELAGELKIVEQVHFYGRVAADQVPAFYQLAAVSVEPALANDAARGRCPLKLFESWAMGTPLVTVDVGDRRELLGEPPAGILAIPEDPASLAQAIATVLADPALAQQLAQRGMERVDDFSWEKLAQRLWPHLQQLAGKQAA